MELIEIENNFPDLLSLYENYNFLHHLGRSTSYKCWGGYGAILGWWGCRSNCADYQPKLSREPTPAAPTAASG